MKNIKASIECIHRVMDNRDKIRNVSIISHEDEGKSALTRAIMDGTESTRVAQAVVGNNVRPTGARDINPDCSGVSLFYEKSVSIPLR